MSDTDKILNERGGNYGSFEDNAKVQMGIIREMMAGAEWHLLSEVEQAGLINISIKISRMVTQPSNHADNPQDIEGYARLIRESYSKVQPSLPTEGDL